jgi:hypothetical protein
MIDLIRIRDNVASDMLDIAAMFGPGAKIAILVRIPGHPEHDFISTDDDPAELVAMLQRKIEADGTEACIACDLPFRPGDKVLADVDGGLIHKACCGPERESYVKNIETKEPLGPDDPIPEGFEWYPWRTPVTA